MSEPILELRNITKRFAGVEVLHSVSFGLMPGEVHALLGENGAGKSTLVKVMTGVHQPDAGEIILDGQPVHFASPRASRQAGIAAIYQELSLFPNLNVAENIFAGRQPTLSGGRIDWRGLYNEADRLLSSLGVRLDLKKKAGDLSIGQQQMVEIARAISVKARILIMDEPTSSLTLSEVADLFRLVRRLQADGTTIVFISHRLEEIYEIANRVTVLRDGSYVDTRLLSDVSHDDLIRMMVGRRISNLFPKQEVQPGDVILRVEHLARAGVFEDVNFELRRGEILGFAGLVGAGRTEVARAIFGIEPATSGTIRIQEKPVSIDTPGQAIRLGLAYVPEDRQIHGLIPAMDLVENISLPRIEEFSTGGWLNTLLERTTALASARQMEVRASHIFQKARELSGGNQQKVVLAKWLATQPRILILDEPTRGIDVGTKTAVHALMSKLAAEGMAILMISSELPEVLGMSDRVVVMREGHVTAQFTRAEATQEKILYFATRPVVKGRRQLTVRPQSRPYVSFIVFVARFREVGLSIFILLLIAMVSLRSPVFLSLNNFQEILINISILVIVALAQSMVIITHGIDLSVSSIIGLVAMMVAFFVKLNPEMPMALAVLLGMGLGGILGLINGIIITFGKVPPIIATLGTLSIYRGLIFYYSSGTWVNSFELPDSFKLIAKGTPLGLPNIILYAIGIAIIVAYFLNSTRTGRDIYAVGGNPDAAQVAGIRNSTDCHAGVCTERSGVRAGGGLVGVTV